ncbi:histidine phosphatase family protein [Sulfitobacter sp. M57]|uniref:histidine phosphatase family protein n=1 Tax=unclassified Sulfitobacter TaxID=196795 RepID=UPI0023E2386E|nr:MULTISPECIES: histidine phosphatase family protein [unclassified Sulfitobacter]MDF3414558.1 histidine phosphatase family protein [Sulfitobacter sp. KE5]MDF3422039.1 histidine phosphatase family protein [Sulfitobacter sp. KE43]MDF3433104.1 histidine phosphatase family protein [Sulfitobacter sp. KE42]MDF3458744.1 histidine phosphatase family protein [Sulfitobacter sp. S74]MDF3462644.1 histidine phosphatase family protein [Sulfitobacter sp. Ks18]
MTVWHWVRHGPTHEKTFVGWRDVPADLSDAAQIVRLQDHLPETALVISSDLLRCTATADVLQQSRTRLSHHRDLREMHFGVWDGMHFKDVAARDPDLSRAYWETPGDVQAPGGESWNQTAARVNGVVDAMNAAHPDTHIIAVAHFGVILTQVQRALGVTPYAAMAHKIDNLSVTTLIHQTGDWQVEKINHLV